MNPATLTQNAMPAAASPRTAVAGHARPAALFGQGSAEPYARALKRGKGSLMLRPLDGGSPHARVLFDVQNWCSPATPPEQTLLGALGGPLLDIGCGPGRLLTAAQTLGIQALGLDTSAQAVEKALNRGTRALHQSVFAPVPQEGRWRSGVLLDANIGIGGNVSALLRRCAQLLAPDGTLLVEADPDDDADTAFQAVMEDDSGNLSEPFGWARVGRDALATYAERADWQLALTQRVQGRVFCRLVRRPAALSSR